MSGGVSYSLSFLKNGKGLLVKKKNWVSKDDFALSGKNRNMSYSKTYPHIHSPYILLILIFYYLVIYTVVVGHVDKWISIQKCLFFLSLKCLTMASQANLLHVDNLSTAHFGCG
jgi:hypothetical protein